MDKKQKDKLEHFFGTLVIKEEKVGFANKSVIVDGQQRLTTTLIFLIALRDSETEQNKVDFINLSFLTNNTSTFQDKIKLKQVTRDWDSYKSLVNGEEANPGEIKIAYELFKKLIREKKRLNQELKELQAEYDEVKPTTPTGTRDWYVKWLSMILAVLGVFLISASYTFYGQITYFLSAIGWIYVGMQWGDRAIMIGSAVTGTAVAMSLIENLPKYLS